MPRMLCRIVKRGRDPFEPPPWSVVGNNRFDCPERTHLRTLYAATTPAAACGEVLAPFRYPPHLLLRMAALSTPDPPISGTNGSLTSPLMRRNGVVTEDWFHTRDLGWAVVTSSLPFVDLVHPHTLAHLRTALAPTLAAANLGDFDLSTVFSAHRAVTQQRALHLHRLRDEQGQAVVAGIRYLSRMHLGWECWALFADRMDYRPVRTLPISATDPQTQEALDFLDISIEEVARYPMTPAPAETPSPRPPSPRRTRRGPSRRWR